MPSEITKEDIITTDKYFRTFPENYYKTDCITQKSAMWWRNVLVKPPPKNSNLIISGHSDYGITDDLVEYYNPKIWYTVNKQTVDSRVHSLPLGITNNTNESSLHPVYGNLESMIEVMQEYKQDKNLVYMNFNTSTFPHERRQVFDLFQDKEWVTKGAIENTIEGRTRFLRDIRNHTFVLCPRGNGVDTHRLWETLYMGSIPIVKRNVALADFEDLPICFINDWFEVTPEFLVDQRDQIQSKSWNMQKLKVTYWIDRITSCLNTTNVISRMIDWASMNTGQVKLNQSLGSWVQKYAEDTRFSRYLEIGTWNGGGSTVCFAVGLSSRSDKPKFISLETDTTRVSEATLVWKDSPYVEILHARILDDSSIPTFEMVETVHSNIQYDWHMCDIHNFRGASYFDVDEFNPEVVMLDGGEYMTYFEYIRLKDIVKVFLLDDTSVAKCKQIVNELSSDPSWNLVAGNQYERNGWHVFEKKTI
jgi:hypothetical protein